eukprot:TRINITY_DN18707_c0_g1_i4.p1 TRINITY_DN18707_c0_g1~~TRINITY_DN18707_c0_g1_i4.p1  ORF type:complete len:933 (-),score=210.96 TRINITY_DN18707_c0_g1_i4:130-2928(-)
MRRFCARLIPRLRPRTLMARSFQDEAPLSLGGHHDELFESELLLDGDAASSSPGPLSSLMPVTDTEDNPEDEELISELQSNCSLEESVPGPCEAEARISNALHGYQITRALELWRQALEDGDTISQDVMSQLVVYTADASRVDEAIEVLLSARERAKWPLTSGYDALVRQVENGAEADRLYGLMIEEMELNGTPTKRHNRLMGVFKHLLRRVNWLGETKPDAMEDCRLYFQLEAEISAVDEAVAEYEQVRENMEALGKSAEYGPGKLLVQRWYSKVVNAVREEQRAIAAGARGVDRSVYGPFLQNLKPEHLAVIALNSMMELLLKSSKQETDGSVKFNAMATKIGAIVQAETNYLSLKEFHWKSSGNKKEFTQAMKQVERNKSRERALQAMVFQARQDPDWGQRIHAKVGAVLMDIVMEQSTGEDTSTGDSYPAFSHQLANMDGGVTVKRHGTIKIDSRVKDKIQHDHQVMSKLHPKSPAMVCQPQPWSGSKSGGYLQLPCSLMRTKGLQAQSDALRIADLSQVYRALNSLSAVQWRVDPQQFQLLKQVVESGGGYGGLPSMQDEVVPELLPKHEDHDTQQRAFRYRHRARVLRENANLHSLRSDLKLKMESAERLLGHGIYFPHNVDFRGRAYPIPPHFNHLGADFCRGLLTFNQPKPLGKEGLYWLKVHLANLHGEDKRTFDGRLDFIEDSMLDIMDSADNPLTGRQWWLEADEPWQCLLTARELTKAVRCSEGAEMFGSRLPVHQDGSCNGLQHYAALGRDSVGASQVDLLPMDIPQDVYSGVMELVKQEVIQIAGGKYTRAGGGTEQQQFEQMLSKKLIPFVDRKLVKQTVMTSVYGVTFVGAREQIGNRLREKGFDEDDTYRASMFLAKLTLTSIGQKFVGADKIKVWLGDCAANIARTGQDVAWVTPLGLPAVSYTHLTLPTKRIV